MNSAPVGHDLKRLAILCPSWVGDCAMATPVFRAVKEARAHTTIIAIMRPGLDQLLGGLPWIDQVICVETKSIIGAMRTIQRLRAVRPDAVLLLPNSFRAALVGRLCGAPVRIGYDRDGRGRLLTDRLAVPRSQSPVSTLQYYLDLGQFALGIDRIDPQMQLAVTNAERESATRLLDGVDQPFIVINPGANKPTKRWPADRFAAVADSLAQRRNMDVVVSGSPSEADVVRSVVDAVHKPAVDLVQRGVTLGSLKGVIDKASLVITNDTGPRHIAAALGTPIVGLFGPTDHRWTDIQCPNERIVVAEPFLPHEHVADQHPKLCAIEKITIGDVVLACEELLCGSVAQADASPPTAPASTPSSAEESC